MSIGSQARDDVLDRPEQANGVAQIHGKGETVSNKTTTEVDQELVSVSCPQSVRDAFEVMLGRELVPAELGSLIAALAYSAAAYTLLASGHSEVAVKVMAESDAVKYRHRMQTASYATKAPFATS